MPRTVILSQNMRVFERAYEHGVLLANSGYRLNKGDQVTIGEPLTMSFDHQNKIAIPFCFNGEEYFFLEEEFNKSLSTGMLVN